LYCPANQNAPLVFKFRTPIKHSPIFQTKKNETMKFLNLLIVFALFAIVFAHGDHGKPEDPAPGVVDVTPENVDEVISKSKNALVEFYAPWWFVSFIF
jgi:hypothetical protein